MSRRVRVAWREAVQVARKLGLEADQVQAIIPMEERHGHRLWRVVTTSQNYVLKWFPPGDAGVMEIEAYALLRQLDVPTLAVHRAADDALLLEDLVTSPEWRLATQEDVVDPAVGRAVARWYRVFHRQGAKLLAQPSSVPDFLAREIDRLDADSIRATGRRLDLQDQPGWRLALRHADDLKDAMRALPETLNYNDFYWTNLALSRAAEPELRAIVFDYHLLGIGVRFSDWRNVVGSLAGEAVAAFWQEYGPPDEREEILDRPLSTLASLVTAVQRDRFPRWAQASLDRVLDGRLERDLLVALELVRGWGL